MAKKLTEGKVKKTLNAIKNFADKLNRWPTLKEWDRYAREKGYYTFVGLYYQIGKSWETIRKEMGFPEREKVYSREECIEAVKSAAKALGDFFTRKEYDAWKTETMPTSAQISRQFKGFNNAKKAAGLIPNKPFLGKTYTEEELLKALKACSLALGEKFSETDYMKWNNGTWPHIETIRVRFGGLANAKKLLQLETFEKGPQYKYANGEWQEPLMKYLEEMLNSESYKKWAKKNNGPSLRALNKNVGGFDKALIIMLEKYIEKLKKKV